MNSAGTYYWTTPSGEQLSDTPGAGPGNEYILFAGQRIAWVDSGGTVRSYWGDHLGTTRIVTDAAGNVCYDADFYPFQGERPAYVNTCAPAYRFAGMKFDQESGDYYTLNRSYPPNLGRWLSPDPLAGDITNPQSLNRYAYVLNNPTSLTDPLGLDGNGCGPNDSACQANASYTEMTKYAYMSNLALARYMNLRWEFGLFDVPAYVAGTGNWNGEEDPGEPLGPAAGLPTGPGGGGSVIQPVPPKKPKTPEAPQPDKRSPCIGTFANSLFGGGSTSPGDEALSQTAEAASTYTAGKAAQWAAERGLIVPLRSSIVRTWLGASEFFGAAAEVIPLAMLTWAVGNAAWQTAKANYSGQCRPGLSYLTHP